MNKLALFSVAASLFGVTIPSVFAHEQGQNILSPVSANFSTQNAPQDSQAVVSYFSNPKPHTVSTTTTTKQLTQNSTNQPNKAVQPKNDQSGSRNQSTVISSSDPNILVHVPPTGFNPLTASDSELKKYGLPERPTDPKQLAVWQYHMSRAKKFVVPQFTPVVR